MATGSFADLRAHFPQAEITLLVRPGRDRLLDGLDCFDELLIDDSHRSTAAFVRLLRSIRARQFDLAVLFTNSFRTALLVSLAGVSRRIGFRKGGQEVLLTDTVEPVLSDTGRVTGTRWKPRPMAEIYADLVRSLGVPGGDSRPHLAVPPALEVEAAALRRSLGIAVEERLIGLAPGASFGASKLWPPRLLAQLADRLTERRGQRTIIFAGPGEEAIAEELESAMETTPINTAASPLGLDLLKPFVRDLDLLVTMDSGPRHFGVALGVPTVVIMGPTDPRWTNAWLESTEVIRHDVPCGPCHLPVCPIDHICMTRISPDEVLERIDRLEARLAGS